MSNLLGPHIPHEIVWVEYEGTGRRHCAVCGRPEEKHPEFWDVDVPLEDEEDER